MCRVLLLGRRRTGRLIFTDGEEGWPANRHAKDSKGMNKNCGSVHMVDGPSLKNCVNALIQSAQNGAKGKTRFRIFPISLPVGPADYY